jgi:DNA-directed RNA polymerase subunit L
MDVALFQEQRDQEMNEIVGIVNPSSQDFTCKHDSNADGNLITYTIKSREGVMLKRYIADHVSSKLCTQILSTYKGVVTPELMNKTLQTIRLY